MVLIVFSKNKEKKRRASSAPAKKLIKLRRDKESLTTRPPDMKRTRPEDLSGETEPTKQRKQDHGSVKATKKELLMPSLPACPSDDHYDAVKATALEPAYYRDPPYQMDLFYPAPAQNGYVMPSYGEPPRYSDPSRVTNRFYPPAGCGYRLIQRMPMPQTFEATRVPVIDLTDEQDHLPARAGYHNRVNTASGYQVHGVPRAHTDASQPATAYVARARSDAPQGPNMEASSLKQSLQKQRSVQNREA